jgi:hypothetical protein
MLTIFSTPKPFEGHSGIIQRNALMSWKLLHPQVEIILFGDEPGTAEVCHELGLHYEPDVERTEDGPPSVRSLFDRAQQISCHTLLCYSNCDILLGQDFVRALQRVSAWTDRFLMVGRRWDTDITAPVDFADPEWDPKLREFALANGVQRLYYNIDYFAFSKGLYTNIPRLAIGRRWWDQWAVWKASAEKAPVVDATGMVVAVHQNHDYSSHPQGQQGVWFGDASKQNFKLAGGWSYLHTIEDATHSLTAQSIEPRRLYWLAPARRAVRRVVKKVRDTARVRILHPVFEATRPVRHAMGLEQRNFQFKWKKTVRRHELDR